ncbi:hypothetical protein LCGC14_2100110 [marine sediment metagenome]|uniref:Uncharacterized protein n=1 Tax=marine sediment metagenome TaxID=412755 RepID=A0A0F9EA37_9ZZZZ
MIIEGTCICGASLIVNLVGEGKFTCPSCGKAYERVFNVELNAYEIVEG